MAELTTHQERRIEGISGLVKEFMDTRFEHAVRINPNIAHCYADLSWQQLVTLKQILAEQKAFGPVRHYVCDILASDDEAKKNALYSATDQNSILNEILNITQERRETRAGILNIRDIRSFYTALDPSLAQIVELIQTWIWWDLPDASDIFSFDQEYQRIVRLAKQPPTEKIIDYYRKLMRRPPDSEITQKEILEFELHKLEQTVRRLKKRREEELGFQIILKRDEEPSQVLDDMIQGLAKHIGNLKRLQETKDITEEIRKLYANTLQIPAQDISKEIIIQYEENSIKQLKQKIRDTLNLGRVLGSPYNYKLRKVKEIEERFLELKTGLLVETREARPIAAS